MNVMKLLNTIEMWNWFWFEDKNECFTKNQFRWKTFRLAFFTLLTLDTYLIMTVFSKLDSTNKFHISKFDFLYERNPIYPFTISGNLLYDLFTFSCFCSISSAFGFEYNFAATCSAITYSLAFFSTLLDSFQHHYLLCLILVILIFKEVGGEWVPRLLSVQLSIVYLFTIMTKLTDGFLFIKGRFIPNIAMLIKVHNFVTWISTSIGIVEEYHVWSAMALFTVFSEIFLAMSIVVAVRFRNETTFRTRLFVFIVWIVGTCLHISFEVFGSLRIRFFSWYMVILYWGLIGPDFFIPKYFLKLF